MTERGVLKDEPIKIAIKNEKHTKLKSKTPKLLSSNLIYKLNCEKLKKTSVGQTSQWLKSRLSLHNSDITKGLARCALSSHVKQSSHNIDFNNAKIIVKESNYKKDYYWK